MLEECLERIARFVPESKICVVDTAPDKTFVDERVLSLAEGVVPTYAPTADADTSDFSCRCNTGLSDFDSG